MTQTATSPRYHSQRAQQPRTTTTPATNPDMAPFLSPRITSPQRHNAPGTPSPNYFGFKADESSYMSDNHAKTNWSPPSSTVRSTAAISPSVVPLDQDAQFEDFRKQSQGGGMGFNLGGGLNTYKMSLPGSGSTSSLASRPSQSRTTSRQSVSQTSSRPSATPRDIPVSAASHRAVFDPSTSELSRSPKRMHSTDRESHTDSKRRASPPTFDNMQKDMAKGKLDSPKSSEGLNMRLQLPLDSMTSHYNNQKARAETLPITTDTSDTVFATPQHIVNLLDTQNEDILLLDLRVQTQYANSHINSALNLCIPTTLLKRPSFNVQKLADTFKDEEQRAKFENWKKSSYIVVYDANCAVLKDATICLNTIKKFRGEGYDGTLYIVKGGFREFAKRFPKYVESGLYSSAGGSGGVDGDGPMVAPAVGGCPMPATDKPANPFFGNIRQNMDLIGGVGQIELKHPSRETSSAENEYPEWIKDAAAPSDKGKKVANRFEQIERREKKRMEDALSGKVQFGTPTKQEASDAVRIAGLEKGNKNRYNNIWPFEHSRVRVQGVPNHGCDYFNASHIKASYSNKRYISTQAPIPATMNDFWNVIWQQDVRVIVMLTAEKEGAQVKAHNYWEQSKYGSIHLDFLSEKRASLEPSRIHKAHQKRPSMHRHMTKSQNPGVPLAPINSSSKDDKTDNNEQPFVIVRKFTISHDRFPFEPMREITQLQYSSWPDFGAPAHPAHLLGLVEQTNAVVRATTSAARAGILEDSSERPVLVHCSAGCGRTGTFCTVDSVIDMIKRQRIDRDSSRENTPMDIDSTPPHKKPSRSDAERNDAMRRGSNGGFFASYQEPQDGESWVTRDDVDLVEKTVEDFRHQRISMVQSLRQYVLCYESVMEWMVEQRELRKEKEQASMS